jgi:4-amino-4-deoxy-L-arabinose transferase-like glycosyltransferase
VTLLCMLLACVGLSTFVYEALSVPQRSFFAPDWGTSQWIQAQDGQAPVAYFRYTTPINGSPDAAFVTIAANQVFRLYVNGILVGSNTADFTSTGVSKAYMYDILSFLVSGPNVLGIRVANGDRTLPILRANLGIVHAGLLLTHGSDPSWRATTQDQLVNEYVSKKPNAWARSSFLATSWQAAMKSSASSGRDPQLTVEPGLYTHPMAARWLSAGSGQESYLVGRLSLPAFSTAWLRLAASGNSQVFLNGSLLLNWQGEAPLPHQRQLVSNAAQPSEVSNRSGISAGIYPLTPYLHSGQNILAVHVQSPGNGNGLDTFKAALALDLLVLTPNGEAHWLAPDASWHASGSATGDWLSDSAQAQTWPAPLSIARPGKSHLIYLPSESTDRAIPFWTPEPWLRVALPCILLLCLLWFLFAYGLKKHYVHPEAFKNVLHLSSLTFLPPLFCAGLFALLSQEPAFPSFYTWHACLFLLFFLAGCYALLWWALRNDAHRFHWQHTISRRTLPLFVAITTPLPSWPSLSFRLQRLARFTLFRRLPLLPLFLLTVPLVCYGLFYEPYWQDELSSYYAAQGILASGLPHFPSGFLYEKAELFSYLLAFWQLLHLPSRLLSVLIYFLSLPLLYRTGCYFFERRCALLATTLMALSPSALLWSQQVRMYELAQVLLLLTLWLFYRAMEQPQRPRLIYLAMGSLLAMYLSHEETFIALPGLLVAVCMCSQRGPSLLPAFLYQRHWWYATFLVIAGIGLQLLLVQITHPPVLGTDSSQRPMIQLSGDNIAYYIRLLFLPSTLWAHPDLSLDSLLALGGICLAFRRRRGRFCALFLLVSFACLILLFTMRAERYIYPLLPIYYLLAASCVCALYSACYKWISGCYALSGGIQEEQLLKKSGFRLVRWGNAATFVCVCFCLLLMPLLPLSNANLLLSRVLGLSYHQHYPDYDVAGQYIQSHWRAGDIVICVAPDFSVFYYSGHADYFLSLDRALFLFERNGQILDTSVGARALLQQDDLLAVLNTHKRVWLVSDNGVYQAQATKRFSLPSDMHLVFEGYSSLIYLRGS